MKLSRTTVSVFLIVELIVFSVRADEQSVYTTIACFGNLDPKLTTLNLDCISHGGNIQVLSVSHGAKAIALKCPLVATFTNYRPECCTESSDDCVLAHPIDIMASCNGKTVCNDIRANWQNTAGHCNEGFMTGTNYMKVEYLCLKNTDNSTTSTPVTSTTLDSSTSVTTTTSTTTGASLSTSLSSHSSPTSVSQRSTHVSTHLPTHQTTHQPTHQPTPGSTQALVSSGDDELSSGMISAIIGSSIGMVLIIVIFAFYTGRRRALRIEGKPQPTVWDYLLPSVNTVRGERGYDHFPNRRSVNSTTSSEGSTIGARQTDWKPNIAPGAEPVEDDAASVCDNNETILKIVSPSNINISRSHGNAPQGRNNFGYNTEDV